jgi:hypothetical protein
VKGEEEGLELRTYFVLLCVFLGWVSSKGFIFWIFNCYFVRYMAINAYHTCFFSFLFNCFDVAKDWTSIHKTN